MHSNLNCLLPILMHTIFPIFLTQCQFGILWTGNVTCSTYGPFMNHLRSSNSYYLHLLFFFPSLLLGAHEVIHTWTVRLKTANKMIPEEPLNP